MRAWRRYSYSGSSPSHKSESAGTQHKVRVERGNPFLLFPFCRIGDLIGSDDAPPFHNARRVANGLITPKNTISFQTPTHVHESAANLCKAHDRGIVLPDREFNLRFDNNPDLSLPIK